MPLVSLRVAAGRWCEGQASLEESGKWAEDWVTFDTRTPFERGIFVARVQGRSIEPDILDGSYCLFQTRGGSCQGRRLLVRRSGISDPAIGGRDTRIVLKPLNLDFLPPVPMLMPEHGSWRSL